MKWSAFINGDTKNTIFEGEEWVYAFSQCRTPVEAARYFNNIFENRWSMTSCEIADVRELCESSWPERFAMIKLFGHYSHTYLRLMLNKETIHDLRLEYFKFYKNELRDRFFTFIAEITPKGNIAVYTSIEMPGPDSDSEIIFCIFSPQGQQLKEWQSDIGPLAGTKFFALRDSH